MVKTAKKGIDEFRCKGVYGNTECGNYSNHLINGLCSSCRTLKERIAKSKDKTEREKQIEILATKILGLRHCRRDVGDRTIDCWTNLAGGKTFYTFDPFTKLVDCEMVKAKLVEMGLSIHITIIAGRPLFGICACQCVLFYAMADGEHVVASKRADTEYEAVGLVSLQWLKYLEEDTHKCDREIES